MSDPRLTDAVRIATRQLKPRTAYLGFVAPDGSVGIVEASSSLPGHAEALASGQIPQGSRGFSFVTDHFGKVMRESLISRSTLNLALPGFALSPEELQAIFAGLPLAD